MGKVNEYSRFNVLKSGLNARSRNPYGNPTADPTIDSVSTQCDRECIVLLDLVVAACLYTVVSEQSDST